MLPDASITFWMQLVVKKMNYLWPLIMSCTSLYNSILELFIFSKSCIMWPSKFGTWVEKYCNSPLIVGMSYLFFVILKAPEDSLLFWTVAWSHLRLFWNVLTFYTLDNWEMNLQMNKQWKELLGPVTLCFVMLPKHPGLTFPAIFPGAHLIHHGLCWHQDGALLRSMFLFWRSQLR